MKLKLKVQQKKERKKEKYEKRSRIDSETHIWIRQNKYPGGCTQAKLTNTPDKFPLDYYL